MSSEEKVPAAVVPVRQNIEFTPEQFARYEALLEKIAWNGESLPTNRADMLLELLAFFAEKTGPRHPKTSASGSPALVNRLRMTPL
jgi:hypothetical protein